MIQVVTVYHSESSRIIMRTAKEQPSFWKSCSRDIYSGMSLILYLFMFVEVNGRLLKIDCLMKVSARMTRSLTFIWKKKSERNGWIITIWNNAGSSSDELARIWHIAMRIWYCTTWGLKIWRIKKKEKRGWRTLLLLTMSSNNKCWGAMDSLLPFAVKKTTPFYIGCAPEYKIWYNNNNNSSILRNDRVFVFFFITFWIMH